MSFDKRKRPYVIAIVLFIITVVINYLSTFGVIFPNTQEQISDMHANLLAPAGFTFSIWGLIYLGVIANFIVPHLKKMSSEFVTFYYNEVMPAFNLWMIFNIIWIVSWSYDKIIISLIAIILYTISLIRLVGILDSRRDLSFESPWLFLFPIGLHTGWLTFASFTNVMTLMVKYGFDAFSQTGVIVTIVLMVLAVIAVLALFMKYDNAFITVPALWALFGIFMKQRSGSDYEFANKNIAIAAVVLFVIALIAHFIILKKHRDNRPLHA